MAFIVLGVLIVLVSLVIRGIPSVSRFSRTGLMVGIGFVILGFLTSAFVTIEAGSACAVAVARPATQRTENVIRQALRMAGPP